MRADRERGFDDDLHILPKRDKEVHQELDGKVQRLFHGSGVPYDGLLRVRPMLP
jgi:hypothetical protein